MSDYRNFWRTLLKFLHETIVLAIETYFKMASTLCQNQMTPFIFHYSKNYGSLILDTKFKNELNMCILPCLFERVRTLNLHLTKLG